MEKRNWFLTQIAVQAKRLLQQGYDNERLNFLLRTNPRFLVEWEKYLECAYQAMQNSVGTSSPKPFLAFKGACLNFAGYTNKNRDDFLFICPFAVQEYEQNDFKKIEIAIAKGLNLSV